MTDLVGAVYFCVCAALAVAGARRHRRSRKNPIRGAMGLLADDPRHRGAVPRAARAVPRRDSAHRLRRRGRRAVRLRDHAARPRRRRTPRDQRGRIPRAIGGGLFGRGRHRRRCRSSSARAPTAKAPLPRAVAPRLRQRRGRRPQLFTDALVPFELSSALLMVAVVGAVAVARGRHKSDSREARRRERRRRRALDGPLHRATHGRPLDPRGAEHS